MSWSTVPIGDLLVDIQPGFASGENLDEGTLQVRMNNVKPDGSWDWSKKRVVPATSQQLTKYSLKVGDILFNATNSAEQVGKSALYNEEIEKNVCFSNHFLRLRTDEGRLLPSYLVRYLASLWHKRVFENMVDAWVNQATVRRDDFLNLKIPLPPLTEQQRITAILDKADAIRRKRQQAIQLADEFLRAVFLDMFGDPVTNPKGWEVKSVGEVCDCIVPGRDKPRSFSGSIPWITTNEISHLGLTYKKELFLGLSSEEIEEVRAKIVPPNSVIMTCVGDLGVVSIAGEQMVINQQLHAFLPNNNVTPSFLSYSLAWQKGYMVNMASSTTLPYMNKTVCNSVPVILPPKKLQDQFESLFLRVSDLKSRMRIITQVPFFEAISQKAFSGAL